MTFLVASILRVLINLISGAIVLRSYFKIKALLKAKAEMPLREALEATDEIAYYIQVVIFTVFVMALLNVIVGVNTVL